MRDYYQLLEVPYNAEPEQIKRSYYQLAKKYHPDVCETDSDGLRFKLITIAYETLMDEHKRQVYDKIRLYKARTQDQPEDKHATATPEEESDSAQPPSYAEAPGKHRVVYDNGRYYYQPDFDNSWQSFVFHLRHVVGILGFGIMVVLNFFLFAYGGYMIYAEALNMDKLTGGVVLLMGATVTYHTSIAWGRVFTDYSMYLMQGRILERPSSQNNSA